MNNTFVYKEYVPSSTIPYTLAIFMDSPYWFGIGYDIIVGNDFINCDSVWYTLAVVPFVDRNYYSFYFESCPNAKEIEDTGIWDTPYKYNKEHPIFDVHPLVGPVSEFGLPEVKEEPIPTSSSSSKTSSTSSSSKTSSSSTSSIFVGDEDEEVKEGVDLEQALPEVINEKTVFPTITVVVGVVIVFLAMVSVVGVLVHFKKCK